MKKLIARLVVAAMIGTATVAGGVAAAPAASAHNWTYPPCPRSDYTQGRTHHHLVSYSVNRNVGSMQPWVTMTWRITQYSFFGKPTVHLHTVSRRCDI